MIEEKRNEEKATKKNLILRLQSMLVWISICKENHALRAWREITWNVVKLSVFNILLPTLGIYKTDYTTQTSPKNFSTIAWQKIE